ncbi:helicase-associated domain-containing protein [Sediminivirga luteola]|uniref:DNA-binding protein n=1 Tax=Sediminivirga luteola TaxID=1774748 RepID=A0A8J2TVH2_9MICO|nr:helicase-associated domain-containing protein [Sediminivirga luteola]MCI2265948.1 helicase-associated domain-containing protein [Sediminivirga luteola]GGA03626.1 DNA-binding protein [Sediminivirga luteola]
MAPSRPARAQTFTAWLSGLDAGQVAAMAMRRPDTLHPLPRDLRAFTARASSRASVARAVDHLNAPELTCLLRLAEAAEDPLGSVPAEPGPALDALILLGLVWPAHPGSGPAGLSGADGEAPAHDGPPLAVRLQPEIFRVLRAEETDAQAALSGLGDVGGHDDLSGQPGPAGPPGFTPAPLPADRAAHLVAGTVTSTIGLIIALLDAIDADPPRRLRSGGMGRRDAQRLAQTLDTDQAELAFAVELAYGAALIGEDEEHWLPTRRAGEFSALAVPEQWAKLMQSWWASLRQPAGNDDVALLAPGSERAGLPGLRAEVLRELTEVPEGTVVPRAELAARLRWRRPLGFARRESLLPGVIDGAIRLGLATRPLRGDAIGCSPAGRRWSAGERNGAREEMAALLPAHTHEVLLQADLTAIVPGVPAPELRGFLTSVATPRGRGQGQIFRFTPESVTAGMHRGLTAQTILERLREWSPTGIPQPLEYLIADADRRFGRIRVGRARGYVRTEEPDELERILAQQPIGLGLQRIAPTVAISAVTPVALIQALEEIGVRAVAEQDGVPVVTTEPPPRAPEPSAPAISSGPRALPGEAVRAAAERWLAEPAEEPQEGAASAPESLAGRLQDAASAGRAVIVTAADSRGGAHQLHIVPLSVHGGRIRARRVADDAEITLVLHRVQAVRPAG